MTNVEGRKPKGRRSAPKAGEGAASGVDGNVAKRFSVQRKMAVVARMLRGEPLELVARETNVSIAQAKRVARACARRRGYSLKERERDDATTRSPAEIQGGRDHHGQRAALRQDRGAGGQTPFGPTGGRDDKRSTLASFACCYGLARVARVWKISRASVYRSLKETSPNTSAVDRSVGACSGRGTGRSYPPANRCLPPSRRGLPQVMGARLRFAGVRASACATGDA